jgi:putative hydrolase
VSPEDPPENPFAAFTRALGSMFPGMDTGMPPGTGLPGTGQAGADPARQIAMAIASEGASEPNVDPVVRMEYESLLRVAELQVASCTGLTVARSGALSIRPVTRTVWASSSVDAYRPYLSKMAQLPTDLAGDLGDRSGLEIDGEPIDPDDPRGEQTLQWLSGLMAAMAPMMAGMTTGTMVGRLALRSLGTYDLPIPRPTGGPDADTLLIVSPNVEAFSADWSLPADDLRLWICLHEVAHHAVLGVPHVRHAIGDLLARHAGAFRTDPAELGDRLGLRLDDLPGLNPTNPDPAAGADALAHLQDALDPEAVLGAVRSPEQEALLPRLEALVAVVVGVVDHVMDTVGTGLIGSYGQVTEALRRRRVTTSDADRFVERILGLNLTQEQVDRGSAFVTGVVERAGEDGLALLWTEARNLPTPSEVDAPGLWLARLELPDPPSDD